MHSSQTNGYRRRRTISDLTGQEPRLPGLKPGLKPGSPACNALIQVNGKSAHPILIKRMRIGAVKLGPVTYNTQHMLPRRRRRIKGNVINPAHEQYALTYGMMSGIYNSVTGSSRELNRQLTMTDFMRVDKRVFPPADGGKLKHPFKFKDYSPDIFQQIRRRFDIDSTDYMATLCGDFNYIEFISNSKSGQFFFFSHDGKSLGE